MPESTDALLCASMPTCRPVSLLHGLSNVADDVTRDPLVLFLRLSEECCATHSHINERKASEKPRKVLCLGMLLFSDMNFCRPYKTTRLRTMIFLASRIATLSDEDDSAAAKLRKQATQTKHEIGGFATY